MSSICVSPSENAEDPSSLLAEAVTRREFRRGVEDRAGKTFRGDFLRGGDAAGLSTEADVRLLL